MRNLEIGLLNIFGEYRCVIVPESRFDEIIKNGLKCDGSSIGTQATTECSDIKIFVDSSVAYPLPNGNNLLFAHTSDKYDSRRKLVELEKKLPHKVNIGAEIEFFLFPKDVSLNQLTPELENKKYFDEIETDAENCLKKVVDYCVGTNIQIEAYHHECAPYQYELDFKFGTPVATADKIVYLKKLIKYFAKENNLVATFMPKPLNCYSGSGMHTNISVYNSEKNLFWRENGDESLSEYGKQFSQNILNHIGALTHFACPTNNSYKRLAAGLESPTNLCVSASDRTAVIRVPKADEDSARIEFRLPDVSANPYMLFLAILTAAFDETCASTQDILPTDLKQSLEMLKCDPILSNLVSKKYFEEKYSEYYNYQNKVSSVDYEMYLKI